MKNAKKVFAMLIVLALAISMAIPVSAATGKITITNAYVGQTYSAYKMADLIFVEGDSEATPPEPDKYAYSIAAEGNPWLAFWQEYDSDEGANYLFDVTLSAEGDIYTITAKEGVTDDQMAAFAVAAVANAKALVASNKISAAGSVTAASGDPVTERTTAEITGLEDGYYAVDTTTGTVCILNTVDGDDNTNILEKNTVPQVDKEITKVNEETVNAEATDVKIGDIVEFTITVPVVTGAHNYVVTDTLSDGLDLVQKPVLKDSFTITGGTAESVTYEDRVITIDLSDTFTGNSVIIKYQATVNADAITDGNGLNTVNLNFGDSDNFTYDTVEVFPLEFDISKTDGTNALVGAEFVIYQLGENDAKVYLTFNKVGNKYVYTGTANSLTGATTLTTTDGSYNIDGLEAGTYYILETKAPEGYNKLADATVLTITATPNTDEHLTVGYSGGSSTSTVTIVNNTGTELPSTGATGTIIFITVGGLMVVAMGVLLVVRKRMSKVVYTR